jgi:DNA-3-methyladenine glycosylase I
MADSKFYRCEWTHDNPFNNKYHDHEWGVPVHDDTKLFEFLILDAFQAGLSWLTILKKRDNFRKAFDNFDFKKIAEYDEKKIDELTNNEGIIRNKLKIRASVTNAKAYIEIINEFGSFDKYIWQFTDFKTIKNNCNSIKDVQATSPESDKMSKDLKKRSFKFVGSTICYAFMQAAGMINDHEVNCFRYNQV